jgi:hypothetical protein
LGEFKRKWVRAGLSIEEIAGDFAATEGLSSPVHWRLFWLLGDKISRASDLEAELKCELRYQVRIHCSHLAQGKVWVLYSKEDAIPTTIWTAIKNHTKTNWLNLVLRSKSGEVIPENDHLLPGCEYALFRKDLLLLERDHIRWISGTNEETVSVLEAERRLSNILPKCPIYHLEILRNGLPWKRDAQA